MSKQNSEFNYRYLVKGETPWAKIQTLQGFLDGRKRAAALEAVADLRYQAQAAELAFLEENGATPHVILNLRAELLESDIMRRESPKLYQDNRDEIEIIERLLAELYVLVEPTRIKGYSDEQMFEVNAPNEFTMVVAKEIQSEIMCHGHPSPAKLHNAMSNPYSFKALQLAGLIPADALRLVGSPDPLYIEVKPQEAEGPLLLG